MKIRLFSVASSQEKRNRRVSLHPKVNGCLLVQQPDILSMGAFSAIRVVHFNKRVHVFINYCTRMSECNGHLSYVNSIFCLL